MWKRSGWVCLFSALCLSSVLAVGCSSEFLRSMNSQNLPSDTDSSMNSGGFSFPHFIANAGAVTGEVAPFLGPYGAYALIASNLLTVLGAALLGVKNKEKTDVLRELHNTSVDPLVKTEGLQALAKSEKAKRIVRKATGDTEG
jgi:hypothetical protein